MELEVPNIGGSVTAAATLQIETDMDMEGEGEKKVGEPVLRGNCIVAHT